MWDRENSFPLRLFSGRVFVVVLLLTALVASPAWAAKKKKKSSKSNKDNMAYLQGLIDYNEQQAAKSASAKAAAEQKLYRLQGELAAAQQSYQYGGSLAEQKAIEVASTSAAREAAEERILAAQDSDSLYHELRKSLEAARQTLREVRERLTQSAAYKSRLKPATGIAAAARNVAQSPADFLRSDAEYVKAERVFRAAETVFNQHKSSLFAEDGDWVAATSTARQVLTALGEDRAHQDATARKIGALKIAVRSAAGLASDADAAFQARQAVIAAASKSLQAEMAKAKKKPSSYGDSRDSGSDKK